MLPAPRPPRGELGELLGMQPVLQGEVLPRSGLLSFQPPLPWQNAHGSTRFPASTPGVWVSHTELVGLLLRDGLGTSKLATWPLEGLQHPVVAAWRCLSCPCPCVAMAGWAELASSRGLGDGGPQAAQPGKGALSTPGLPWAGAEPRLDGQC